MNEESWVMQHVCRCFESTTHYRLMIPSWEPKTRTVTRATNLARHEVASSSQELLTLLSEGPPGNLRAWWRFWNLQDVALGAIFSVGGYRCVSSCVSCPSFSIHFH